MHFSFAVMKLSELRVGQQAIITGFEKNDISIKLMEMGFIPGETIRIEKFAPFGDPICVLVAGYNLSLRIDEAQTIEVHIL